MFSICLVNFLLFFCFESTCFFAHDMGLLKTAYQWLLTLFSFPFCLLIGAFNPFTFRVNIVICEFDPVIMMLAGYFADLFMWLLHSVTGLYISLRFWSDS